MYFTQYVDNSSFLIRGAKSFIDELVQLLGVFSLALGMKSIGTNHVLIGLTAVPPNMPGSAFTIGHGHRKANCPNFLEVLLDSIKKKCGPIPH